MKNFILTFLFACLSLSVFTQINEVPFTPEDRGRIIKLEVEIDALNSRVDQLDKSLNGRIDDVNKRINRLEDTFTRLFMWGFGMILIAIFGLFSFILYDRRTTIAPVRRGHDKLLKVLREYGLSDKKDAFLFLCLPDFILYRK
jgi:hypothetical protein